SEFDRSASRGSTVAPRRLRVDAQPRAPVPRRSQRSQRRHVRQGDAVSFDLAPALPALLRALDGAHVGFLVIRFRDGVAEKVYGNETLASSLGYTTAEYLAIPLYHSIAPEQRAAVIALSERLAHDAPIPAAIEVKLIHREGHEIVAEVVAGRMEL